MFLIRNNNKIEAKSLPAISMYILRPNAQLFLLIDLLSYDDLVCDRPKRTLYSKKYGVDLIRYTHAANTVVYSSNKIDGMLN